MLDSLFQFKRSHGGNAASSSSTAGAHSVTPRSATPDSLNNLNVGTTSQNKHNKGKTVQKKGQRHPKQLPTTERNNSNNNHLNQQNSQLHNYFQQHTQQQQSQQLIQQQPHTNFLNTSNSNDVMTTLTYVRGTQLLTTNSATSTGSASTASNIGVFVSNEHQHLQHQLQQQLQQKKLNQQKLLEANHKMQELQLQIERLGREKHYLETRIEELLPFQSELGKLKGEFIKIQNQQEKTQAEMINLKYENESLRNRLRDVVNSPLSDTEKHQIIQDSQRLHNSAPASIALPSALENDTNNTPCITPDWDKHSSSSEISVACLQDKIIQMEETHYSTNEELQATLQELTDLQTQLGDAQAENERLAEEKDVLFQSLCCQTEKLNDTRNQLTTLQELLLRDNKQAEHGTSERENKLLDVIKSSQEERETILVKQEELNGELMELHQTIDTLNQENKRSSERISLLESTVDAANAEKKQMEAELLNAKEEISQRLIEINRLTTLLENARSKIDDLEQDLARGEKSDLSDLLDAARKEKDTTEERCAELQEQFSRSQAEISRLKDQLSVVTEECKVAKNNAKCAVSHLEYRLEQIQQEKDKLGIDFLQLSESTSELQVQSKCHLEDKTQLQKLLSETQKHLSEIEHKLKESEGQLDIEIKMRKQEAEEWQQFQSDLLMTVRVANDFKTEALTAREQLVIDNKSQKEKIRFLEQQLEKLTRQSSGGSSETSIGSSATSTTALPSTTRLSSAQQSTEQIITPTATLTASVANCTPLSTSTTSVVATSQSVLNSVQQEITTRRKIYNFSRQDSRLSVKTLIESIENNKPKSEESESRYSSTSSLNSYTPEITAGIPPSVVSSSSSISNNEWSDTMRLPNSMATALTTKGHLREQQQQQQQFLPTLHFNSLNPNSKTILSGERKDPLNMLAKNGGSKRNALLKWCQNKTVGYRNIDITNFSSSWNDGLAFCAILHSYLPDRIPYDTLNPTNKRRNFSLAFTAAESVGIPTTLNINDMCQIERPDWTQVMTYVTAIYKHFET